MLILEWSVLYIKLCPKQKNDKLLVVRRGENWITKRKKRVVSNETVLLRRLGLLNENFVLSSEFDDDLID